ncbi:hypothetical protein ACT1U9_32040 [Streptomyces sp. BR1]|uniref:hypothetical protein n=1 Tax=Streptomyces sp. BR1 TaxID=1592323 RepID=UPI00402B3D03
MDIAALAMLLLSSCWTLGCIALLRDFRGIRSKYSMADVARTPDASAAVQAEVKKRDGVAVLFGWVGTGLGAYGAIVAAVSAVR